MPKGSAVQLVSPMSRCKKRKGGIPFMVARHLVKEIGVRLGCDYYTISSVTGMERSSLYHKVDIEERVKKHPKIYQKFMNVKEKYLN